MKAAWIATIAGALTVGTALAQPAQADEHEKVVSIDSIPAPARAALLREAQGTPIERVEIETEKNHTLYEGVIKQGAQDVGINVDAQGNVLGRHPEKDEPGEHR